MKIASEIQSFTSSYWEINVKKNQYLLMKVAIFKMFEG